MDEQKQDDQLEPTYSSSVPIRYVALRTCRKQWMIKKGDEKGSGISVLMVQHDDDDIGIYITGFGLNNLQGLICHKTQPNQTSEFYIGSFQLSVFNDTIEGVNGNVWY